MELLGIGITFGLGVIFLVGLWRIFPQVFVPRCPQCYTAFDSIHEREPLHPFRLLGRWQLVWHRFVCPMCGYRWQRIEIARSEKGIKA